jgi:hypothetical protein
VAESSMELREVHRKEQLVRTEAYCKKNFVACH